MIGFGYDIHRLEPGRPLVLGGVAIPATAGPVAHSDGDVALHALCDALLGAAALGDIGKHFPDSAQEYRGISSLELLKRVRQLVGEAGFTVGNVDVTIVLERPKIGSHSEKMIAVIAEVLHLAVNRVSIKATTNEGIGSIGAGDAIAAYAVVQLVP